MATATISPGGIGTLFDAAYKYGFTLIFAVAAAAMMSFVIPQRLEAIQQSQEKLVLQQQITITQQLEISRQLGENIRLLDRLVERVK